MNLETHTDCCFILATRIDDFITYIAAVKLAMENTGWPWSLHLITDIPKTQSTRDIGEEFALLERMTQKCLAHRMLARYLVLCLVFSSIWGVTVQNSLKLGTFLHDSRGGTAVGYWGCEETKRLSSQIYRFGNPLWGPSVEESHLVENVWLKAYYLWDCR